MKKIQFRGITIVLLVFLSAPIAVVNLYSEGLTAKEVMEMVDNRDDGETAISETTMVLIDKGGNQRIRKLKGYRKDYGQDKKNIRFFLSPADVRNVAFLAYDWNSEDKEDDNWLYLPAIGKPKRISSSNEKDSFMGSDFSYADMNGLELTDWDYRFLKDSQPVDGFDCWVIESLPKASKKRKVIDETGYLKIISWIRKDNYIRVQAKMYVEEGRKIKYFSASDIVKIQNIWSVKKLTMKTTSKNHLEHTTVLLFDDILYNKAMDENMFTTQRMQRGL
ncbi:outer membrane lipoprotein-sorting protein [bacterium]|nr:outer membrane lipoprotein-sorting protein [bacterium]